MKVAAGLKTHSGWAVLIVVAHSAGAFQIVDRRRIELVEQGEDWAKQPYHAAENLEPNQARAVVKRGIEASDRVASRQLRATTLRLVESGHEIMACAVLLPAPMPNWSTEEILAVHVRMHKAEGVLFPGALCRAAESCGLRLMAIPEAQIWTRAEVELGMPREELVELLGGLGKKIGPPWTADQKSATLAAMVALKRLAQDQRRAAL